MAPDLLDRFADLHLAQGDYELAAEALRSLVELSPADEGALRRYGLLLAATDPEGAIPVLARLAEGETGEADAFRELGLSIRRARAVSALPEYISLEAGRALAAAGEWEMARLAFERAVDFNPSYAEAWAYLGEARGQSGSDGREALDTAYALDPDSMSVNLLLALHLQREGDPAGAMDHLNQARSADPLNPTLVAEMASIVASSGDIEEAISLFERAIQLAPQDPLYWKILANFSIQNETQVMEVGLPAARQAALMAPADPEALDLLGQAYLAAANPVLAERFLKEAIALDPAFAPAAYHLGVLYLTIGSVRQARDQLELTMRMAPGTPLADLADQLIQNYLQ
jgi:tetratricopeptide (TPR) repeat protein